MISTSTKNRIFGLDVLRALAILFVVWKHAGKYVSGKFSDYYFLPLLDGVTFFFVLSGFLIGKIIINNLERSDCSFKILLEFWKRRWIRTLPNYFLVLIIICLFSYNSEGYDILKVFRNHFLFIQNLWYPPTLFFFEAWSLSVEEWFYFLVPFFMFVLVFQFKLTPLKSVIIVCTFLILFSISARLYKFLLESQITEREFNLLFEVQVITRLDSIMFGVLGAVLFNYFKLFWTRIKYLAFFSGLGIILIHKLLFHFTNFSGFTLFHCVFSFSFLSIGILCMLPLLNDMKDGNKFLSPIITHISVISYSMYLVNISIVQNLILNFYNRSASGVFTLIYYLLFWGLTVVIATLLYKFFELPILNLRDKFLFSDNNKHVK